VWVPILAGLEDCTEIRPLVGLIDSDVESSDTDADVLITLVMLYWRALQYYVPVESPKVTLT
jgi:hypothetical protein